MNKKKRSTRTPRPSTTSRDLSRRRRRLLIGIGAVPVLAFGGVAIHRHDVETRTRHDLSVLGEGTPVVVQVHDPSCPQCRRLMGSTLGALESRDDILYRVADLTTSDGAAFGARYGVGKVTLLLFDGRGRHVDTVQGVTPASELTALFDRRFGSSGDAVPS